MNKTERLLLQRLTEAKEDYLTALDQYGEPSESEVSHRYQAVYQALWELAVDAGIAPMEEK